MAISSSMRRRSGLTTTEACSWDIEGTSRDEGDPSCSEPHPTPSSSHRLHQLYSTPPQALPRSGFVHGRKPEWAVVGLSEYVALHLRSSCVVTSSRARVACPPCTIFQSGVAAAGYVTAL